MRGALRARLVADAAVAALVAPYVPQGGVASKAIFWVDRPQGSPLPAIRLQIAGGDRPQHLKGFQSLRETRVQMDVLAASYEKAWALTEAAIAALVPEAVFNGIIFNRALVSEPTDRGEQAGTSFIHRTQTDLLIWWQAA